MLCSFLLSGIIQKDRHHQSRHLPVSAVVAVQGGACLSLSKSMRQGGVSPSEALNIAQHVTQQLHILHQIGMLHGSVKPERVYIDTENKV